MHTNGRAKGNYFLLDATKAIIKQVYGEQVERQAYVGVNHIVKDDFLPLYHVAYAKAIAEKRQVWLCNTVQPRAGARKASPLTLLTQVLT